MQVNLNPLRAKAVPFLIKEFYKLAHTPTHSHTHTHTDSGNISP